MDKELGEVFSFMQEDLDANRNGYISKYQISILRKELNDTLLALLFVIFGLSLAFMATYSRFNTLSVLLGFLTLEIPALLLFYRTFKQQAKEVKKVRVIERIEGKVWKETLVELDRRLHTHTKYYIGIDEKRFLVSSYQSTAFLQDATYRIYFTADKLLSCEMVSSPEIIND
jgi:hypothetical protein